MDPAAAQAQVVERLNQASNILVTVSNNPSVDQLSACIGLTLLLNRLDKHATAVFSGRVPSTIEFLQPEKTLESNTDSLRDFIISLDKEKADKLRYKVEDQFVRIFITPYKTSLTQKDLVFSQGDFNVEVVLALGAHTQAELDAAITAHGRILHDATIVSVIAGKSQAPNLGQINWVDQAASSLSEMLVGLGQTLGNDLLDNQMATAFLTGVVSETQRFSNAKTTPKAMAVAGQLMAAGANQQLIASKLEPPSQSGPGTAGTPAKKPPPPPQTGGGVLSVSHHPEVADTPEVEVEAGEIRIDEQGNITTSAPSQSAPQSPPAAPAQPKSIVQNVKPLPPMPVFQPSTSVAPTPPVQDNSPIPGSHTLLNPTNHQPAINSPMSANTQPGWEKPMSADPLSEPPEPAETTPSTPTNITVEAKPVAPPVITPSATPYPPVDSARQAVDSAIAAAPFDPSNRPLVALNSQPIAQNLHQPVQNQPPPMSKTPPPPVPPPLMTPKPPQPTPQR